MNFRLLEIWALFLAVYRKWNIFFLSTSGTIDPMPCVFQGRERGTERTGDHQPAYVFEVIKKKKKSF